jgi:hypothetical protein
VSSMSASINTSLCAHLLLGGVQQVTIGAAINDTACYLCLECSIKHILDLMVVHKLPNDEIDAMLNFESCGHFDAICGCCMGALRCQLTIIAFQAKLSRNMALHHKVKKLLRRWHQRYGDVNVGRIVLKPKDAEIE